MDYCVPGFGLNSGRERHNTPDNKRIHVYCHHSGIVDGLMIPSFNNKLQSLANSVWAKLGVLSHTHYHKEYSYCFITFATHEQAQNALNGMKDVTNFKNIIEEIKQTVDVESQGLLDLMFVGPDYVTPSWAGPKPSYAR